jgi:hypothetical protein
MRNRIYKITLGLVVVLSLSLATTAQAKVPCTAHPCRSTLHATSTVQHLAVKGNVGEKWLLYLNVFVDGKGLGYRRLSGGCEAAYDGRGISVLLHACGHRSTLDYVALGKPARLSVEYRYVQR